MFPPDPVLLLRSFGCRFADSEIALAELNWSCRRVPGSALARFEPRMGLVDDVDAPLAAHDTAILVAFFQRIDDLMPVPPSKGR